MFFLSVSDYVVGKTGAHVYNSTHSHLTYFSVSKSINQFSVDKLSVSIRFSLDTCIYQSFS